MATREQAVQLGALGTEFPIADDTRSAGYMVRETAYVVEDAVLDFLYAVKASFLAIPEIAMIRAGNVDGEPLGEVALRDKIVAGIVFGVSFAALAAVAVLVG
ncbi:MAG: hypothetical protein ACOYIP_04250 [Coriobacteriales bacterium]|jgi:hypothetical protein